MDQHPLLEAGDKVAINELSQHSSISGSRQDGMACAPVSTEEVSLQRCVVQKMQSASAQAYRQIRLCGKSLAMRGHSEASLFKLLFSSHGHRRHFFAEPIILRRAAFWAFFTF